MRGGGSLELTQQSVNRALSDQLWKEDSVTWFQSTLKNIEDQAISWKSFNQTAANRFDRLERYLDNQDFQRENIAESCEDIGIQWREGDTIPRMAGMAYGVALRSWQIIGISWLGDERRIAIFAAQYWRTIWVWVRPLRPSAFS